MALMTCLAAHGQEKWTLRQCIDYAMQNNITLKQSQVKRAISTETRKASEAALLPSLSASTNQTLGYRPWTESGTVTVNNGTVSSKVRKTYYNGTYGINAKWTVWNGNKNHNQVKLDRLSEEQANLTVQETANTQASDVQRKIARAGYMPTISMTGGVGTSTSTNNANEWGQQMLQVGKMSKADLAQLSSQRATDEYNLIAAKTDLADRKLQLKQLLEITGEQEFDVALPTADDAQALADIPDLLSVYEAALAQRPEIKNAELALQASDVQRKIARAGYMPTISMTGGVGTSTSTKTWRASARPSTRTWRATGSMHKATNRSSVPPSPTWRARRRATPCCRNSSNWD